MRLNLLSRITFVFFVSTLISNTTQSQIISKNWLMPDKVTDIRSRTLIVELLKEDTTYVKKLKAAGKTDEVASYHNWIIDYNKLIQKYIGDYWKINTNVVYRFPEQIKTLVEQDKKIYALLLYTDLEDINTDVYNYTDLMVPAYLYHRADMPFKKPDVKFPIPSSYARGKDSLQRTDFIAALMLLQNEVDYIQNYEEDKKTSYMNYIKTEPLNNCGLLRKKTILLEPFLVAADFKMEVVKTKMKCNLPVTMSNAAANNDIVYNATDGYAMMLSIPVNYVKDPSPKAPYVFKRGSVAYAKVIVDTRNFKILSMVWPNISMVYDYTVKDVNFKKLCSCPD